MTYPSTLNTDILQRYYSQITNSSFANKTWNEHSCCLDSAKLKNWFSHVGDQNCEHKAYLRLPKERNICPLLYSICSSFQT